jgi:hypothetical protein
MRGVLEKRRSKRSSFAENVLILCGAVIAIAAVTVADRHGAPQRWHAAVTGTVVPFLVIVWIYRMRWPRWTFWASLTTCLAVHVIAIYIFFAYVLRNVKSLALLLWFPVMFIEVFVLLVVVQRLDDKFGGRPGHSLT